ncbi:hypothetical protein SAMN02982929_02286 [Saccharopolyspora kobensis]|uniref:Tryptophan-associated transmembrane protein n=1 Tax=Saccharopolyspora kobensis TaxID=146035 RepID=A0A1H6AGC1_9PSEU|nr:hypothetical protein [Saccharopolyspora kobensis]SEG47065.1 hypothetical protein SAMN02982929_02286 [Saccharopolyspora kobensis]SFE55664.1 hypothetical protein SAMN05216506_112120 [Saccharopolyspora kobensis]
MRTFSNRVQRTHRLGAAVLGAALLALGIVQLPWTPVQAPWPEMSAPVAAATAIAGFVLVCAAPWGSRIASSTGAVLGAVFLLAGLAHLALLHTSANVLGFALSTALFCIGAGAVLLVISLFGRVSGGLPPDNPYRRSHPIKTHRPDPDEQLRAEHADEREQRLIDAEVSMAQGTATPQQFRMVKQEWARRREEERRRAHRHYEEQD